MSYQTKNTDCRDTNRTQEGFEALTGLMVSEIRKYHFYATHIDAKMAGRCCCCRGNTAVAFRIYDRKNDNWIDVLSSETERIDKIQAGACSDTRRWWVFPVYYCDILLDRWQLDERMEKISPLDSAYRMIAEEKREAKMAFSKTDGKTGSGVERL